MQKIENKWKIERNSNGEIIRYKLSDRIYIKRAKWAKVLVVDEEEVTSTALGHSLSDLKTMGKQINEGDVIWYSEIKLKRIGEENYETKD